jgi:hypothetical protein
MCSKNSDSYCTVVEEMELFEQSLVDFSGEFKGQGELEQWEKVLLSEWKHLRSWLK